MSISVWSAPPHHHRACARAVACWGHFHDRGVIIIPLMMIGNAAIVKAASIGTVDGCGLVFVVLCTGLKRYPCNVLVGDDYHFLHYIWLEHKISEFAPGNFTSIRLVVIENQKQSQQTHGRKRSAPLILLVPIIIILAVVIAALLGEFCKWVLLGFLLRIWFCRTACFGFVCLASIIFRIFGIFRIFRHCTSSLIVLGKEILKSFWHFDAVDQPFENSSFILLRIMSHAIEPSMLYL
mmetsp:Transcript_10706/g.15926  ORF Transcript_10706/g.15926 Transcript_10706/m.15926 type:complete len:237 (-) Transcript_10706:123-833(-)